MFSTIYDRLLCLPVVTVEQTQIGLLLTTPLGETEAKVFVRRTERIFDVHQHHLVVPVNGPAEQ